MSAIDRVRIMVLGDSGVGKTSVVHLAAHNEPLRSPSWTIGCSVEVKLHEYKEGTKDQKTFFIEFWDIGGSKIHRNSRGVYYNPCHGAILVHDLTNRKSEQNLNKWLRELLHRDARENVVLGSTGTAPLSHNEDYDPENLMGTSNMMPILVIGTKLDQIDERKSNNSFSFMHGADEILLDCTQTRYLAAGTSNAVKLSRFYDKVIDNRSRDRSFTDRFGTSPVSPIYSSKFYSPHQD